MGQSSEIDIFQVNKLDQYRGQLLTVSNVRRSVSSVYYLCGLNLQFSACDPLHFDTDPDAYPDPRIRICD